MVIYSLKKLYQHQCSFIHSLLCARQHTKRTQYTKILYTIQNILIKSVKNCYAHLQERPISDEANESHIFTQTVGGEILNAVIP